jgi:hypothetical protein
MCLREARPIVALMFGQARLLEQALGFVPIAIGNARPIVALVLVTIAIGQARLSALARIVGQG